MPRFLLLVVTKPVVEAPGYVGAVEMFEAMTSFNKRLSEAGVLLHVEGLCPTSDQSYRLKYHDSGPAEVVPGPFDLAKENHVSGFWLIKTKNAAEALEWAKQAPFRDGEELIIRKVAGN